MLTDGDKQWIDERLERLETKLLAYQQAQLASQTKGPAEWLATHTEAIGEIRELQRSTDQRIDKLVVAIGEFIRSHEGST